MLKNITMKNLFIIACAMAFFPLTSCAGTGSFDSSPVSSLDISRYLGKWYEIARFDHSFEKGIDNATAEYSLMENGMVKVLNSGWKDGKRQVAEGKAKLPDPSGNPAHLRVSFFMFFYADYNVMMLDEDYQYALIGSKSDKYLWILSRTPEISSEVKESVLAEAQRRGYDTDALIWVDQSRNL